MIVHNNTHGGQQKGKAENKSVIDSLTIMPSKFFGFFRKGTDLEKPSADMDSFIVLAEEVCTVLNAATILKTLSNKTMARLIIFFFFLDTDGTILIKMLIDTGRLQH